MSDPGERHRPPVSESIDNQAEKDDAQAKRIETCSKNRSFLRFGKIENDTPFIDEEGANDEAKRSGDERDDARHEEVGFFFHGGDGADTTRKTSRQPKEKKIPHDA